MLRALVFCSPHAATASAVSAFTCFCVRPPRVLLRLSVNFHTMPGHQTADEQADGTTLQNACQTLFETMGLRSGSRWQVAAILCPVARPLISWLATNFPDRRLVLAKQVSAPSIKEGDNCLGWVLPRVLLLEWDTGLGSFREDPFVRVLNEMNAAQQGTDTVCPAPCPAYRHAATSGTCL